MFDLLYIKKYVLVLCSLFLFTTYNQIENDKKKTHHFRVQLQQQNLTVQKCKIRTVHSTFTIKQIMQLLFQIKAKCKFFFLLFTLQMSVLLLIASGQKSILENSVLGFEKKFNEPL